MLLLLRRYEATLACIAISYAKVSCPRLEKRHRYSSISFSKGTVEDKTAKEEPILNDTFHRVKMNSYLNADQ